jgi:signal transduction histidine kinase
VVETNHLSTDRRRGYGRRATDQFNPVAMRGVVHDVANAVGANEGLIASVLEGEDLPPTARRRLRLVHREHQRLLAFLGSFLDENRAVAVRPVEVREIVESVAAMAAGTTAARVTVADGPDVTATTDPVALWRALHNLVGNAVRAAGPRGHVEIVVAREGDTVWIDVVDSGPGFGSAPPGREFLGLELVAGLLATHRGSATLVQDTGPGTRVRVQLPTGCPPEKPTATEDPTP